MLTAMVAALARCQPVSSTMVERTYTMVEYEAFELLGGGGVYVPSADTLAYFISMFSRAAHPQLWNFSTPNTRSSYTRVAYCGSL